MTATGLPLRPGLSLTESHGQAVLAAPPGVHHVVPESLVPQLRASLAQGGVTDRDVAGFLEARHLISSDRVLRVEAWAASRVAAPATRAILPLAGSRFTCHGCGLCCESYVAGPVSDAER